MNQNDRAGALCGRIEEVDYAYEPLLDSMAQRPSRWQTESQSLHGLEVAEKTG